MENKTFFGTIDEKGVVTETMSLDITKLPSHDPLSFAYGISRGQQSVKQKKEDKYFVINHGSNHRDLAKEYLRGFLYGYKGVLVLEGTKIMKGQEQSYALHHLNILK